jgi:hypothetical protein
LKNWPCKVYTICLASQAVAAVLYQRPGMELKLKKGPLHVKIGLTEFKFWMAAGSSDVLGRRASTVVFSFSLLVRVLANKNSLFPFKYPGFLIKKKES